MTQEDHGKVVKRRGIPVIWAWIFPVLAALATLWLFWSTWKSEGPEIEIRFAEAPGIQAGKTLLIYRGVTSGHVTSVRLDSDLGGVVVRVRLKAFAEGLARKETEFWIDQPVISIKETTGLEAIIQGNSIQARVRGGEPAYAFQGLAKVPLTPLESASLELRLRAHDISFLSRGTPIYHRGVQVGVVRSKELDASGGPFLDVSIDENHVQHVFDTTRFWVLPATSLKVSPRGATLDMAGLDALVQGGIAFDHFVQGGKAVADGAEFDLSPGEFAARSDGPAFTVSFEDGHGLFAGETRICYLGQTVGLVESVKINLETGQVDATARMEAKFAGLVRGGAFFTLIRPHVTLKGISGLDTILSGAYIAITPGAGEAAPVDMRFVGRDGGGELPESSSGRQGGLSVRLQADAIPNIDRGTPVYFRGVVAGVVTGKFLSDGDVPSLDVVIHEAFRDQVRANSKFWRIPATSVSAGPGVLDVSVEGLAALVQGGIAFDGFDDPGDPAKDADSFVLFANEVAARADSEPLRINFATGRGLLPGKTQLRYLGVPVGFVESLKTENGKVEVSARLEPGHESLRRRGSKFAVVEPHISLQGVTGLETILSGVYIECVPGTGPITSAVFSGTIAANPDLLERKGFEIRLTSPRTSIRPGANVVYRDIVIGEVTEKSLSEDGQSVVLRAVIDQEYRNLVREKSHFWDAGAIEASIGFLKLKIRSQTLMNSDGKVALDNPAKAGEPVAVGHGFELFKKPLR